MPQHPFDLEHFTGNRIEAGFLFVKLARTLLHARFFDDIRTLDPLADVVKHPRPTLLVQGSADTAVPPAVSACFVQAMTRQGVPLQHTRIDGANHGFSRPPRRAQLIDAVAHFAAAHLTA